MDQKNFFILTKWFIYSSFIEQPFRWLITMTSIAVGVSLLTAINLVNDSAINEFEKATNLFYGKADLSVESKFKNFPEEIFDELLVNKKKLGINNISPVVSIETHSAINEKITIFGLDIFRALKVTPVFFSNFNSVKGNEFKKNSLMSILDNSNAFVTSRNEINTSSIKVFANGSFEKFNVTGFLPSITGEKMVIMDISNAQHYFDLYGKLSRLDIKVENYENIEIVKKNLEEFFFDKNYFDKVQLIDDFDKSRKVESLSKAYKSNLRVLGLVAIFASFFLVFSVVEVSLLKQGNSFLFLRILGLSDIKLLFIIISQVFILSFISCLIGVALGLIIADFIINFSQGNLGASLIFQNTNTLDIDYLMLTITFFIGLLSSLLAPMILATQFKKNLIIKIGRSREIILYENNSKLLILFFLISIFGIILLLVPPINGLPIGSYVSIACFLISAILLIPIASEKYFKILMYVFNAFIKKSTPLFLGFMRLINGKEFSRSIISSLVVSFSLTVSILIMVISFRGSLVDWMNKLIIADLYASPKYTSQYYLINPEDIENIGKIPGIKKVELTKRVPLKMSSEKIDVSILVRPFKHEKRNDVIPLVGKSISLKEIDSLLVSNKKLKNLIVIYVSESFAFRYQKKIGDTFSFPVSENKIFNSIIGGIYRDYSKQHGSVVVRKSDYVQLTKNNLMTNMAIWVEDNSNFKKIVEEIKQKNNKFNDFDFTNSAEIKTVSLQIFDKTFLITYFLAIVSILISVFSVVCSYIAQGHTRKKEFGLLVQLGKSKKNIFGQIATESFLLSCFSIFWGFCVGLVISLILIFKINPESFFWTMDFVIPYKEIIKISILLIVVSVISSMLSFFFLFSEKKLSKNLSEEW